MTTKEIDAQLASLLADARVKRDELDKDIARLERARAALNGKPLTTRRRRQKP